MTTGRHVVRVWAKEDPFGTELVDAHITSERLSATGVAIGTDPSPYRLEYELVTAERFVTAHLAVQSWGKGWLRALRLERSTDGKWSCASESHGTLAATPPGGDLSGMTQALDCDIGLSPLTNSMPILRHHLHESGGPLEFVMAWVSVPDLSVQPSRQRYTFIRREHRARVVRYESLDSDFTAEVRFDECGLVLDYPGIARMVE